MKEKIYILISSGARVELSCSEPINQYSVSKLSQILDYGSNNSLSSGNYKHYVGHQHVIAQGRYRLCAHLYSISPRCMITTCFSHFITVFKLIWTFHLHVGSQTMQVFLPVVQTFGFYHLQHDTQGNAFHLRFQPLVHFPGQSFEQMSGPVQHLTSEFMVKHNS